MNRIKIKDNKNVSDCYVTLKDYITVRYGDYLSKGDMIDGGVYPVISGGKTYSGFYSKYNRIENTISVAVRGSVGFVGFHPTKVWVTSNCCTVESNNQSVLINKYLYYLLKDNQRYLTNQSFSSAVPMLSREKIYSLRVLIPDIKYQQYTVNVLDKIVDLIQLVRNELDLRVKQYTYFRSKIFSNLSHLGEDIRIYPLKEIVSFLRGDMGNKPDSGYLYPIVSGGVKVQGYSDMFNRNEECITVAQSGSAGYISYWDTPIYARDCFSIHCNENKIIPKYLYYYLVNKQSYVYSLKTAGSIPHIYPSSIANMEITVPDLSIQKHVISLLDKWELLCINPDTGLNEEISLLEKYYQYYRSLLVNNIWQCY